MYEGENMNNKKNLVCNGQIVFSRTNGSLIWDSMTIWDYLGISGLSDCKADDANIYFNLGL